MADFLTSIGFSSLVVDFILHPQWLHFGSAGLLILMMLALAYNLRIDIDPIIFRRHQPFTATVERLLFWPVLAAILLWGYYAEWESDETLILGIEYITALITILVLLLGRGIIHFIYTEKNRWDFFDQLPFYLMVEFQFAVPLIYYYQLERNGLMPKEELGFAFACVFICYFLVRLLLGRPTFLARNRVAPYLWLLIGYMLLTVIIFQYRLAAIKNIIQWITFAACFFVSLAYIPDKRRRDAIIITIVITSLVCTFWGFWKYFDVPFTVFGNQQGVYPDEHLLAGQAYFYKTPSAGRYFLLAGFFANPNYYGEYLALVIFIALGLLFATNSLKLRIFLAISLAVNAFEMGSLYNRAGWLGIFVGIFLVLFGLAWGRVQVFRRISKFGLAAGITGLAIVLILVGVVFNAREKDKTPLAGTPLDRLKSMADFTGDETFRNRLTMWRAAGLMMTDEETFPERLIFGGGLGFFEVEYLPYQTKILESYDFEKWFHNVIPTFRAHNDHIQMLVESGIIGTGLYALIFIMLFITGFRFLKEEEDPARRFYALGILGAVACMLGIACFSFPFHKIQHGGLIFTVIAFLLVEITERNQRNKINNDPEETTSVKPRSKGKKRKKTAEQSVVSKKRSATRKGREFRPEFYIRLQRKFPIMISIPLILIFVFLTVWGVYTQVINFKSQYLVVKGIAALRSVERARNDQEKIVIGQTAADYFADAYALDPTNGRAEFFRGFSLIKKNLYQDTIDGTRHIEEGQILYPQSDTFYALAMGYEARRNLAAGLADERRRQIAFLENELTDETPDDERQAVEEQIADLTAELEQYENDASYSLDQAINSYMTAATYYPVKVEYYKDLIRLLQEKEDYELIVFWAERALLVDDWLDKKPPLRWRFYRWLGRSHKLLAHAEIVEGNREEGIAHLLKAAEALIAGVAISGRVYYNFYELALVYEALGDVYNSVDQPEIAQQYFSLARDMYIKVYEKKDNFLSPDLPFNTAFAKLLLGKIYEKLGDAGRALDYYTQALSDSLTGSGNEITAQTARERIDALTGQSEEIAGNDDTSGDD